MFQINQNELKNNLIAAENRTIAKIGAGRVRRAHIILIAHAPMATALD